MPEEIKKVLVVLVEGVGGRQVRDAARSGHLASVARLMAEGSTMVDVTADPTAASNRASLVTGAHSATHGVAQGEECRAEYLWEAAERVSKRTLLLGFPASRLPAGSRSHPPELTNPSSLDGAYYDHLASYLVSSPDWDIVFIRIPAGAFDQAGLDEAVGKSLEAADFETLRSLVVAPENGGVGLAVLAGPGVRAGKTVERWVELVDLTPTICHLAELPIPLQCEGGIIYQALEDPDAKLSELQATRRNYERLRRSAGATPMC